MTQNSNHPILSLIKDSKIIDLGKNPYKLCENYRIPVQKIHGINAIKSGRTNSFEYKGKIFKRVELVALAYYQSLGYEALWAEGAAYIIARVSINGAIVRRVRSCYELIEKEEYIKNAETQDRRNYLSNHHDENVVIFNNASSELYDLLKSSFYSFGVFSIDEKIKEKNQGVSLSPEENLAASGFRMLDSPNIVREKMIAAYLEIEEKPPLDELVEHMKDFVAAQIKRYSQPQMKYRASSYNEWSIDFAKRIIQIMGIKIFGHELFSRKQDLYSMMANFDLMLLNAEKKQLSFVEVKNQDSFTPYQLVAIDHWIHAVPEDRPYFEVCFVQPED